MSCIMVLRMYSENIFKKNHLLTSKAVYKLLLSVPHCSVQRDMDSGCKVEDVIRKLDEEKVMLMVEKGMLMVSDNMFSQRFNTVISF